MFGTVTDSQGAVVPGARITINNAATGVSRSVVTDSSGAYVFSLLPVGSYQLTVELTGFRKYERRNILLQANENIRVDAALDVGNVQETVTVEATAAQVDTRSATLNTTVDSKRIVELPLNGRNPADLVLLAPGVASGAGNNSGDVGGSAWRPKGQKEITVNGSRNNNLRYTLDGGTNMDDLVNENLDFPFPDAVQEFSAQTSNMGVEHGRPVRRGFERGHQVRHQPDPRRRLLVRSQHGVERHATSSHASRTSSSGTSSASRWAAPFVKNKLFAFGGYQKLIDSTGRRAITAT